MLCTRVPSTVHSKASAAEGWGDFRAHLICSLSLLDPCLAFSVFQGLKQWLPVLSSFLVPSRSSLHLCIRLDYFNCKLFFFAGNKSSTVLVPLVVGGPFAPPSSCQEGHVSHLDAALRLCRCYMGEMDAFGHESFTWGLSRGGTFPLPLGEAPWPPPAHLPRISFHPFFRIFSFSIVSRENGLKPSQSSSMFPAAF